jgi:hypothetical protein
MRVSALWAAQNLAFELLARRTSVARLRYEDFVSDPAASVAAVRAMAGLPERPDATELLTEPPSAPRPIHSIAGNPLRFDGRPLRVSADESWRDNLPARNRRIVGAATLPLRLRYGYHGGVRPAGARSTRATGTAVVTRAAATTGGRLGSPAPSPVREEHA